MNKIYTATRPLARIGGTNAAKSLVRQVTGAKKALPLPSDASKLLFCVNKHNSLSQRVALELSERGHDIDVCEVNNGKEMTELVSKKKPDLVLCPFLTKRVPEEVWSNTSIPCLIVHPGIEGDRGMSSIDWAINNNKKEWGVTILQAAEEMDAGDIWSTNNFQIDRENINTVTKSSLYVNEVTNAAVKGSLQTIENFLTGVSPRPLDYTNKNVKGTLMPNMKTKDRKVEWDQASEDISRLVRMSDSSPGAVVRFRKTDGEWSEDFRAFGAYVEESGLEDMRAVPGEIIGQRDDAILVKCGKGALWLSHLKKNKLKLPSTFWLSDMNIPQLPSLAIEIPHKAQPKTFQEIWTSVTPEGVCYVNFNFYNGAMSTNQCKRLEAVLRRVEEDDRCKVVVLKGGYNFFSNGIHLNVIEHASNPAMESWRNINAINDVVERIFLSKKLTISALQGNAGAGGVMMALASDLVLSRNGVVLNPHYKQMHLFGSEYHTYFLPERVGEKKAFDILNSAEPMLSNEAARIGMFDASVMDTHKEFDDFVESTAKEIATPSLLTSKLNIKYDSRNAEFINRLEEHRRVELAKMAECFKSQDYHMARKAFVYH